MLNSLSLTLSEKANILEQDTLLNKNSLAKTFSSAIRIFVDFVRCLRNDLFNSSEQNILSDTQAIVAIPERDM